MGADLNDRSQLFTRRLFYAFIHRTKQVLTVDAPIQSHAAKVSHQDSSADPQHHADKKE